MRQLLARQGFQTMWITLLHAPIMNIKDLPPEAPVPLHLRKIYSGMIDHMLLLAQSTPQGMELSGAGDWFFTEEDETSDVFPDLIRLGEPAFVRGIGLTELPAGEEAPMELVGTAERDAMPVNGTDKLHFALEAGEAGIRKAPERNPMTLPFGSEPGASQKQPGDWPLALPESLGSATWLLLDPASAALNREAREVALRL